MRSQLDDRVEAFNAFFGDFKCIRTDWRPPRRASGVLRHQRRRPPPWGPPIPTGRRGSAPATPGTRISNFGAIDDHFRTARARTTRFRPTSPPTRPLQSPGVKKVSTLGDDPENRVHSSDRHLHCCRRDCAIGGDHFRFRAAFNDTAIVSGTPANPLTKKLSRKSVHRKLGEVARQLQLQRQRKQHQREGRAPYARHAACIPAADYAQG